MCASRKSSNRQLHRTLTSKTETPRTPKATRDSELLQTQEQEAVGWETAEGVSYNLPLRGVTHGGSAEWVGVSVASTRRGANMVAAVAAVRLDEEEIRLENKELTHQTHIRY